MSDPTKRKPLLLSVFATFAVGGAQVRFAGLANCLGPDWRHAIIAMDGNLACRERLDPTLNVTFPSLRIGKRDPVGLYRRLRGALRNLRPDLMLTHNWGSIEWGLANQLPYRLLPHLHVEDGFGPEERSRQLLRRVWARRIALRRATIVLPSRTLHSMAERAWHFPATSLRYIPNGVNLTRFDHGPRSGAGEQLKPLLGRGLDGPCTVVGTVAALRPEKNLARLIRAFALVPEDTARLVIVGDGPERASLEQLAATLLPPGRISFTGHVANPSGIYRHMDIFALSSDTEQMPLSLLEAMASGLPVVATAVGDVPVMVAEDNRPFITGPDEAPIAASLARLIGDPALRRRIGAANRERAIAEYDETRMTESWARLLTDAR